jgi:hypothetical protein
MLQTYFTLLIAFGQLVEASVIRPFPGKVDGRSEYGWSEEPLKQIPEGFVFKVETSMIPSLQEYREELTLIKVLFEDTSFFLQIHKNATVRQLSRDVTFFLNSHGQGGDFRIEGEDMDTVDPETEYHVPTQAVRRFNVSLRQIKFEVEEDESWIHVSERFTKELNLRRWSLFRICPVDNAVTKLGSEDNAYSFD